MAKQTAHQELARLRKDAAAENVTAREAEDDVRRGQAEVERATQQLEDAYVTEDEQRAAKARKALALAQDEREDRQHRCNARKQRAGQATEAANRYRAEHAEALIAERHDEAHTLAVELQEALERVVALDGRWSEHAQHINALVSVTSGAQPRTDGAPAEHPYTAVVRNLRHILNEGGEVPAPTPAGGAAPSRISRTARIASCVHDAKATSSPLKKPNVHDPFTQLPLTSGRTRQARRGRLPLGLSLAVPKSDTMGRRGTLSTQLSKYTHSPR